MVRVALSGSGHPNTEHVQGKTERWPVSHAVEESSALRDWNVSTWGIYAPNTVSDIHIDMLGFILFLPSTTFYNFLFYSLSNL